MEKQAQEQEYQWGEERNGLRIGLRMTRADAARIGLYAAIRCSAGQSIEVAPDFTLMEQVGQDVIPHGSGPRPSEPWTIEPDQILEVLAWSVDAPDTTVTGGARFWVVHSTRGDGELRSGTVEAGPA